MADPGEKKKRATYQDVLDAPPNMVAEIIGGELRLSPRPGAPHTLAASRLGYALGPPFDEGNNGPGGWIILDEPELHIVGEIVVPDLAGWRRERMPIVPEDAAFTIVPDWICEVMSKSGETADRVDKLPIYAHAGVRYAWLVSAFRHTLEVYRLHDGKWLTVAAFRGNQVVRAEPFDAIELDLSRLWRDVAPPPASRASEPGAAYDYEY